MLAILAAFAAIYLIWGSTYLAIHVAIETLPPLLMAGVRFFTAGILMYLFLRLRGGARPTAAQWRSAFIVGGLLLLGGNGLVVLAQQTVPSGVTALLVSMLPLWMVILNAVWPGGSLPSIRDVIGLLIGFVGLIVLVSRASLGSLLGDGLGLDLAADRVDPWGAGGLVIASLCWAFGSLYSRGAPLPASPLMATAMQMICGGGLQLIVGLGLGEAGRFNPATIERRSVVALAYLIVFGSWIAFSAYVWLLRVVPPGKVATYAFVNPVVAVLLGWIFLGEKVTTLKLIAMALIITAVVLITMQTRTAPRPVSPMTRRSGS